MHSRLLAAAILTTFLSPGLAAQELLRNGDFEAQLSGWTTQGPGQVLGISQVDVDGDGTKSAAFTVAPGGEKYAPPHAPFVLAQTVAGDPSRDFLFSCDVLVVAEEDNFEGGTLELWVDGQQVHRSARFAGQILEGTAHRERVSARVRFQRSGAQLVELRLARRYWTYGPKTPHWSLDDLSLAPGRAPLVHCRDARVLGGAFALELQGEAQAPFALYLSDRLLKSPVLLPGIRGALELDPSGLLFVTAGALDAGGDAGLRLPIPGLTALVGLELSFQGLALEAQGLALGAAARELPILAR